MSVSYALTPELRMELKKPLGRLIEGSFQRTMTEFKLAMEREQPSNVISVGDTVSRNLVANRIAPKLMIIDNKCMRRELRKRDQLPAQKTVFVNNPQATITAEAINAIQEALNGETNVKIIVDGEEDLLTLVAILHAPLNSFVVYGQPYEGIVLVKVNPDKKMEISRILEKMSTASKS